jgi:hypothetical protein
VRRYRRKIKNIRKKIKLNSGKIFAKYLNKKLVKDKKTPKNVQNENVLLSNMILTLKKLKTNNDVEFAEDKSMLESFISLIASGKLRPDSIQFKKICTQIRMILPDEKIKPCNGSKQRKFVSFPERNVYLSKKELEFYRNAGDDDGVFRAILGLPQPRQFAQESLVRETSGISLRSNGIFDPILAGLINKDIVEGDEFCNNLFNTDIAYCNNVLFK